MDNPAPATPSKLSDRIGDALRVRHCRYRVVQAGLSGAARLILFRGKRHPMGLARMGSANLVLSLICKGGIHQTTQETAKVPG